MQRQGAKYIRHAALCRAAAVICREALKMCGKCAARLAAIPDCQNDAKSFKIGGKSMSNWLQTITVYHNIYFPFDVTCFLCHQSSRENHRFPNCMSWSLDGSENVFRHLVIKTCTAFSYLARHENCAVGKNENMPRKERKRKTNQRNIETAAHKNCMKIYAFIYVIRPYPYNTVSFTLDGIELQWAITQSQARFRGYDSADCYQFMWILIAFPGETGD